MKSRLRGRRGASEVNELKGLELIDPQYYAEKGYPHPGSVISLPGGGGEIHLQYGHPQEVGRNGCFTTDVIQGLIDNLSVYQARGHPMSTRETALAIARLEEARLWINSRKAKRQERGVHQTDSP